jgi:hypothetical protein
MKPKAPPINKKFKLTLYHFMKDLILVKLHLLEISSSKEKDIIQLKQLNKVLFY